MGHRDVAEAAQCSRTLRRNAGRPLREKVRWDGQQREMPRSQRRLRGIARTSACLRTGTVCLPAGYMAEHVELGYAQTSHATQGRTVDTRPPLPRRPHRHPRHLHSHDPRTPRQPRLRRRRRQPDRPRRPHPGAHSLLDRPPRTERATNVEGRSDSGSRIRREITLWARRAWMEASLPVGGSC